jgi:tetratricopeptide (TPR) repeat protein
LRRKYGKLRKKENVIVFPGTFEKLVEKGHVAVEQENYELAVEAFDQAIVYEPDNPEFLGPYAVALYETKDFQRAKEIAAMLLHSGTADYVDAMELYLTISIQLQEYDEVEMTIDALMDEGIVPPDMMKKFNYLRELNGRLSERYAQDEPSYQMESFTLDEFMKMDALTQQYALASL